MWLPETTSILDKSQIVLRGPAHQLAVCMRSIAPRVSTLVPFSRGGYVDYSEPFVSKILIDRSMPISLRACALTTSGRSMPIYRYFRYIYTACMAVPSGPARPVLAGPVFTLALKIAHAQTITNRK